MIIVDVSGPECSVTLVDTAPERAGARMEIGSPADARRLAAAIRAAVKGRKPAAPMAVYGEPEFEALWREYPRSARQGRKAAFRHFCATVRTPDDLAAICAALVTYLKSARVRSGYVMNGSTWFNQWRDWVGRDSEPERDGRGVAVDRSRRGNVAVRQESNRV